MNKAFVREPEDDGREYCPRCRSLGVPVEAGPLDSHIRTESRASSATMPGSATSRAATSPTSTSSTRSSRSTSSPAPVYPKDPDAPICACFGFNYDDVVADVRDGTPTRIRALLAKSKSPEAHCQTLAADGRCCMAPCKSCT